MISSYLMLSDLSLMFRRRDDTPAWRLGGAVPPSFLLMFCLSSSLNIAWLLAWDGLLLAAAAIALLLVALANSVALALSARWWVMLVTSTVCTLVSHADH